MDAIRHLATASDSDTIACAEFEKTVHLWGLQPLHLKASLATVLQFGGERLALSPDGSYCFAAAYHEMGVACYDSNSGNLHWQRKDIKRVQAIQHSLTHQSIYCFLDRSATQLVCSASGETIEKQPGTRGITQSSYSPVDLVEKANLELRTRDNLLIRKITRSTFATVSTCFSPEWLLISEAGGGLRCFDTTTGDESWFYKHSRNHHFLKLGYSQSLKRFHGVAWPSHDERQSLLFQIDPHDARVSPLFRLGQPSTTCFTRRGEALVTSDGFLIDLKSQSVMNLWPPPNNSFKPRPLRGSAAW